MSKCRICGKENDGLICRHCLSKKAHTAGKAIKTVGKIALSVLPVIITIATRGKVKLK